jgi:hypothetical protein
MDYNNPPAAAKGVCPVCTTRATEGAIFCAACGAFLKSEDGRQKKGQTRTAVANGGGTSPLTTATLDYSFVQLLGEITHLQRDLLRQFRQGQALQARQFERALQAQAMQLEKTLAHTAERVESSELRLQVWQRWTAGLAAAILVLLVLGAQII